MQGSPNVDIQELARKNVSCSWLMRYDKPKKLVNHCHQSAFSLYQIVVERAVKRHESVYIHFVTIETDYIGSPSSNSAWTNSSQDCICEYRSPSDLQDLIHIALSCFVSQLCPQRSALQSPQSLGAKPVYFISFEHI